MSWHAGERALQSRTEGEVTRQLKRPNQRHVLCFKWCSQAAPPPCICLQLSKGFGEVPEAVKQNFEIFMSPETASTH